MVWTDRYDHMFHFCRRKDTEKNYRINSIIKILKFSYLNLNICKVVQVLWEMMLLDIGFQYLPYAKGINWIRLIEFELG
jgi:hypothetical protein